MKTTVLMAFLFLTSLGQAISQSFLPDDSSSNKYGRGPAALLDTVIHTSLSSTQIYTSAVAYLNNDLGEQIELEYEQSGPSEIGFSGEISDVFTKKQPEDEDKFTIGLTLKFRCRIYAKDQKFRIMLSSLYYNPLGTFIQVPAFPIELNSTVESNVEAKRLALTLLEDMSKKINQKQISDF